MPILDMPLEKLKVYNGMSPRPEDFDKYWERALSEMESVDPKVEFTPHDMKSHAAEFYNLYFTGVGGARVYAKFAKPKNLAKKAPAVLLFHGYYAHSGDWISLLPWVSQGYVVAAIDCRGQGGLSEDVGGVKGNTIRGHIVRGLADSAEKLMFRSVYMDCVELARILMGLDYVDETKLGATGASQGGALTLATAALEPKVKKAAAVFPFLCDFKRAWDMDLQTEPYSEIRKFFRWHDPRHEMEDEIFIRLGYIDIQNLAPKIKADVLMFTALVDDICPTSTHFAAYNKITSKKELIIYPDHGHEYLPYAMDSVFEFMTF